MVETTPTNDAGCCQPRQVFVEATAETPLPLRIPSAVFTPNQAERMPEPKRFPFAECDRFLDKARRRPQAKKVFAIGDSWLAAPGGWWPGDNVVQRLNDTDWVRSLAGAQHPGYNVLSIAKVGCEIAQMADSVDWSAIAYLDSQLASMGKTLSFDAFMVSAGGNDFIPKVRQFVRRDASGHVGIDDAALGGIFDTIIANWGKVRAHLSRWNVPILTNGYGPIVPTLKAGTTWLPILGVGPWVGPYLLHDLGLSQSAAQAIADDVMSRFNVLAASLPGVNYFSLVAKVRDMASTMWHDEIHFVDDGWEQVAECWLRELDVATGLKSAVAAAPPIAIQRSKADAKKHSAGTRTAGSARTAKRKRSR